MTPSLIFERGDYLYFVAPVKPISPSPKEVEEYAFSDALRATAPNEHLLWLEGRYVESEKPNANGHLWTAEELGAKSMTPRLMPITVMHDPRTAVGLIADTRLVKAAGATAADGEAPRTRIDTTLAMWKHRFPDVAEEVMHNYNAGTLMQSMECLVGFYECATCGKAYTKLPGGAEKKDWCQHLKGETASESAIPVRRLRDVTFTGTGLIFGSRGARGAYSEANLDVFQDEVAEFHEQVHRGRPKRRQNFMDIIEIKRDEYDALKAAAARAEAAEARVKDLEEQAGKVEELESDLEKVETEKVAVEKERDELKAKAEEAEETARAAKLGAERLGKLGKGFVAKLGDRTKAKLDEQASKLDDEAWSERLEELAELTGVKPEEGGTAEEDGETFSREEIARSQAGEGETSSDISPQRRSAVVTGLAKSLITKK